MRWNNSIKKLFLILIGLLLLTACEKIDVAEVEEGIDWVTIENDLVFQMGDLWDDGESNEKPVHSVSLSPYQIGKYEITNEQYASFIDQAFSRGSIKFDGKNIVSVNNDTVLLKIESDGCQIVRKEKDLFKPETGKENYPVVCVTWYGAKAFAEFYGWRLPTEAEWERAAKGSKPEKRWPWGNLNPNCDYGNLLGCSESSTKVGQFELGKSQEGCYDLAGNVWEWCSDWMGPFQSNKVENPVGPINGILKVERGGCWPNDGKYCRTTFRGSRKPDEGNIYVGFRVARSKF